MGGELEKRVNDLEPVVTKYTIKCDNCGLEFILPLKRYEIRYRRCVICPNCSRHIDIYNSNIILLKDPVQRRKYGNGRKK